MGAKYGAVWQVGGDPASNWRWFQTLYAQKNGAPFLSDNGHRVSFDEDKVAQTLEWLARMTGPQGYAPSSIDYAGSLSTFGSGDAVGLVCEPRGASERGRIVERPHVRYRRRQAGRQLDVLLARVGGRCERRGQRVLATDRVH